MPTLVSLKLSILLLVDILQVCRQSFSYQCAYFAGLNLKSFTNPTRSLFFSILKFQFFVVLGTESQPDQTESGAKKISDVKDLISHPKVELIIYFNFFKQGKMTYCQSQEHIIYQATLKSRPQLKTWGNSFPSVPQDRHTTESSTKSVFRMIVRFLDQVHIINRRWRSERIEVNNSLCLDAYPRSVSNHNRMKMCNLNFSISFSAYRSESV